SRTSARSRERNGRSSSELGAGDGTAHGDLAGNRATADQDVRSLDVVGNRGRDSGRQGSRGATVHFVGVRGVSGDDGAVSIGGAADGHGNCTDEGALVELRHVEKLHFFAFFEGL